MNGLPYTLHHIKTPDSFNPALAQEVYDLMQREDLEIRPSLVENYSPKNLDIENHLIFSCLKYEHSIIAFCGIYNGSRYPEGVYRILNRSFIIPQKRTLGIYDCFLSKHIVHEQLRLTQHLLGTLFISRPGRSSKTFLEFWKANCAPRHLEWSISERFVHVAPRGEKRDCYQYICSADLRQTSWAPRTLSEQEWLQLRPT